MIGDWMKRFVWIFAVPVLLSSLSFCQAESSASATASSDSKSSDSGQPERMFFPRDTLWGWAQFDLRLRITKSTPTSAPATPASMAA